MKAEHRLSGDCKWQGHSAEYANVYCKSQGQSLKVTFNKQEQRLKYACFLLPYTINCCCDS